MNNYGLKRFSMLTLCAAIASQAAIAQPTDSSDGVLDEIIVTATKRSTNLQSTAVAVTALDAEELEAANINSIRDLSALTPSLTITANAGQEIPIGLRGVSSGAQGVGGDSPVAIYLDGVYLGRQQASTFDFADIERVEISRGPQGTLFGRNNTGGSINVITRLPTEESTFGGGVRMGNYDQLTVKGNVSGPISDNVFFKVSGSTSSESGFQKFGDTGVDANGEESYAVNGALRFLSGSGLDIVVRADKSYSEIPAVLRLLAPTFTGYGTDACEIGCDIVRAGDHSAFEQVDNSGLSVTVDKDWGALSLKSITAYREFESDQLIDTDAIEARISRFNQLLESEQISQEFVLSSADDSALQWLVGTYFFQERSDVLYQIQFFNGWDNNRDRAYNAADDLDGDGLPEHQLVTGLPEVDTDSYALFFDGSYDITDRFTIGLGARYSNETKDFFRTGAVVSQNSSVPVRENGVGFIPSNLAVEYDEGEEWESTDGRIVFEYQFTDDVFGYVSGSTAFKSGGYAFSAGGVLTASFEPEEVEALEVGLKTDLLDNTLRLNLAAFSYDYTDLQIALATQPGVRSIFNAAGASIDGLEADFTWLPTDNLTIFGNASFLDATYDDFTIDFTALGPRGPDQCQGGVFTAGICDLSGNDLPRAPDVAYTIIGDYLINLRNGGALIPRLQYRFEGEVFHSEQNVADTAHGDISLIDARLTYRPASSDWTLSLWGQNLTDERYVAGARPNSIRASGVPNSPFPNGTVTGGWGFPNYPRSYGIEVSVQM